MTDLEQIDVLRVIQILPEPITKMLVAQGKKLFLAGGFIRAAVANERWSDIDLFSPSKDAAEALAKSLGKTYDTDNAFSVRVMGQQVQFIHRWTFDDPVQCVNSFDFTIACAAVWHDAGWQSICANRFYRDLAAKRLVYRSPVRNEDAGGSMLRVLKFYQRGYRIPLDSMGAVVARLVAGVDFTKIDWRDEKAVAKIVTSLLIEVDPNAIDMSNFIESEIGTAQT